MLTSDADFLLLCSTMKSITARPINSTHPNSPRPKRIPPPPGPPAPPLGPPGWGRPFFRGGRSGRCCSDILFPRARAAKRQGAPQIVFHPVAIGRPEGDHSLLMPHHKGSGVAISTSHPPGASLHSRTPGKVQGAITPSIPRTTPRGLVTSVTELFRPRFTNPPAFPARSPAPDVRSRSGFP